MMNCKLYPLLGMVYLPVGKLYCRKVYLLVGKLLALKVYLLVGKLPH